MRAVLLRSLGVIGVGALVADVYAVAGGAGLGPDDALRPLEYLDLGAVVNGRGRQMAAGNYAPSFELTMARKDVRLMQETAGARPLAVLPGVAARVDLPGGHDHFTP